MLTFLDKIDSICIKKEVKTLKQVIKRKRVPSKKLENALKESESIEKEYKEGKRKGYKNVNEMMKSILND